MKHISDIVKKVILLIVLGMFLLLFNYSMAIGPFGEYIDANFKDIIICALALVLIIDALMAIYDVVCIISYTYSNKIWKETKNEVKIGLERNISKSIILEKVHFENKSIIEYIDFIWIFINDKNASEILEYLMIEFDNNESLQPDIAFFFLSNQHDNSVMRFLNEFPDFKNKCFRCSKDIASMFTYDDLHDFNSDSLRNITNELMHFIIGSSSVDINKRIDYIRKVISWICCQVKNKELYSNNELKRFMIIIPQLEQKLLQLDIDDKIIDLNIKKLKKSFCLTKMLFDSNKVLWKFNYESIIYIAYSVGLIMAYPEKFNLVYQLAMQYTVVKNLKLYKKQYHTYYYNAITLLLTSMLLGRINKPNQEIVDKMLSIISVFGGIK